jgi:phage gpG-like protein
MGIGTLTGDLDSLVLFGERVGALGSDRVIRGLYKELADEALFQIQDGFAKERDPYGRPWFPKKHNDGRRILRGASGKLIKSFRRLYLGADAAIVGSTAFHAKFAQTGTGIHGPSKRRIYPKLGRALRFKGPGGKFIFAKSVEGSRQRMMVPLKGLPAPIWMLAMRRRAKSYLQRRVMSRAA